MNKLNKAYSFHISDIEADAIKILREHNINVSRFLRQELRRFSEQLFVNKQRNDSIKTRCHYEY